MGPNGDIMGVHDIMFYCGHSMRRSILPFNFHAIIGTSWGYQDDITRLGTSHLDEEC